jgi:hypothetical protein
VSSTKMIRRVLNRFYLRHGMSGRCVIFNDDKKSFQVDDDGWSMESRWSAGPIVG